MNIPVNFSRSDEIRSLRSLRYDTEESVDLKLQYKETFFNFIVDASLQTLDARFEKYKWLKGYFGFLYDISKPCQIEDCKRLEKLSTVTDKNANEVKTDIKGEDLFNEIRIFSEVSVVDDYNPSPY